jgi:hypothetical protein
MEECEISDCDNEADHNRDLAGLSTPTGTQGMRLAFDSIAESAHQVGLPGRWRVVASLAYAASRSERRPFAARICSRTAHTR